MRPPLLLPLLPQALDDLLSRMRTTPKGTHHCNTRMSTWISTLL
jgi:hypothetical protein